MQLLVSVRNEKEATIAALNGVDRIDLKEPNQGSLGATTSEIWHQVVDRWHQDFPISVALGELHEAIGSDAVPVRANSVKVGLSHCRTRDGWHQELRQVYERMPESITRVMVFYADEQLAESPDFVTLLRLSQQLRCGIFLVDTFDKSAGNVFDHLSMTRLIEMRKQVADVDISFALAGSLRTTDLQLVARINPDIVAVRGAVCHGERSGEVCAGAIQSFQASLRQQSICISTQTN
ncbi:(5-formylfuran-3-yl)methyl phosphate synthase [Bremerella sp. JC817]|uniref:(5-formylfuran-3-yl)methyl phosphate synthase n=1 Tax=Bremerella sp. JC817 TaxID=3231756 RepID=UPI00345A6E11